MGDTMAQYVSEWRNWYGAVEGGFACKEIDDQEVELQPHVQILLTV